MTTYKRETPRQGIIRDASDLLARKLGPSSFQTIHQNVWTVMDEVTGKTVLRELYYSALPTGGLALKRLYLAIARETLRKLRASTPPALLGMRPYSILSEGDITRWR